jgi:hypothetical protein
MESGPGIRFAQRMVLSLRRHWVFFGAFICGCILRILVMLAYQPALFYSDSTDYLRHAYLGPLSDWHPPGYSLFLRVVLSTGTLAAVPLAQHLIILACSILLYATLLRLSVWRQLAALACVPILVDAYQLQIEQYVLSEALFEALIISIIAALLWNPELTRRTIFLAGALLGAAAVVRLDAIFLVLPAAVFAVVSRAGWKRTSALLAFSAIPLVWMVSLRASEGEGFSVTGGMGGLWLYGRVAPFANCADAQIPRTELSLCPTQPLGRRPGPSWFENSPSSPARLVRAGHAPSSAELSDFAKRVIVAQPFDYVRAVAVGYISQFSPTRSQIAGGPSVQPWIFPTGVAARDRFSPDPGLMAALYGGPRPELNPQLAMFLHRYQRWAYTPGPVMAMCLLIVLAGLIRSAKVSRRQVAAALLAALGVIVVLGAVATVQFTWRYMLPSLALLPPAAALSAGSAWDGVGAWTRPGRARSFASAPGKSVSEVCSEGGFVTVSLEVDDLATRSVIQADTVSKQDRRDVDVNFIDQIEA